MKAEHTIFVSVAIGIASVCLLLTCLNMYMLSSMKTTLKNLDGRLSDTKEAPYGNSALILGTPEVDKDELITALYRHLDQQNAQIDQCEMKLQHLAELHEHRCHLLEEQEALRSQHMKMQNVLESKKRKLAKKLSKFQLEKQAHEHRKEIEEYERQLQQTYDQLFELQRRQDAQQIQPEDDSFFILDGIPESRLTGLREEEFPFSPLDLFLAQIFGGGMFMDDDPGMNADVTVSLETIQNSDSSQPDVSDFAEKPTPIEDEDVLADEDANHVVVHRVLADSDEDLETTPMPPALPTPTA